MAQHEITGSNDPITLDDLFGGVRDLEVTLSPSGKKFTVHYRPEIYTDEFEAWLAGLMNDRQKIASEDEEKDNEWWTKSAEEWPAAALTVQVKRVLAGWTGLPIPFDDGEGIKKLTTQVKSLILDAIREDSAPKDPPSES